MSDCERNLGHFNPVPIGRHVLIKQQTDGIGIDSMDEILQENLIQYI